MTGQPSKTAYWSEFLYEQGGDWWTESEAVEATIFSVSGVNDYVNDMLNLGILEQRERSTSNNGPNPREYRFKLD